MKRAVVSDLNRERLKRAKPPVGVTLLSWLLRLSGQDRINNWEGIIYDDAVVGSS